MSVDKKELNKMIRIIRNWTGCFIIRSNEDGYRYAIMGYATNNTPVYVGPSGQSVKRIDEMYKNGSATNAGLIQMGYDKLYRHMWMEVNRHKVL